MFARMSWSELNDDELQLAARASRIELEIAEHEASFDPREAALPVIDSSALDTSK